MTTTVLKERKLLSETNLRQPPRRVVRHARIEAKAESSPKKE
jgi:hypothetical protein